MTSAEALRVSDVEAWTQCELMALRSPPTEGRLAVAAYVGTLAHAILASNAEHSGEWWTAAARYRFDQTTQSIHQAHTQARAIAREAAETLADNGWQIIDAERRMSDWAVTGAYDLLCWHSDRQERAVVDLKTGQRLPCAVWLQVGGYLTLLDADAAFGGVLHVPRVRVNREPRAMFQLRAAAPLRDAWRRRLQRITEVIDGAPPLPTPGGHCDHCTLSDCPVNVRPARRP